jgi:hypothetical protein
LRDLLEAVRDDLDHTNFGVGWWRTGPESNDECRRRIVIGDYLISLLEGVEHGLIDLELHRLELHDYLERESEFLRDAVSQLPNGNIIASLPPRLTPAQELGPALVDLHLVGVFRAGASIFDCVAGALGIVGAIGVDILKTGWREIERKLQHAARSNSTSAVTKLQAELHRAASTALATGPSNWHNWLLAYRNLLVHRGHRLKLSKIVPVPSLFDSRGRRLIRALVNPLLVSDPDVTDIEALGMANHHAPVLEEDARRTLEGITTSLKEFLEIVMPALVTAWQTRRSQPSSIPQPLTRQWRTVRRTQQHFFSGFHPGSRPFSPNSFTMNPKFARRMQAAAMIDPHTALWHLP